MVGAGQLTSGTSKGKRMNNVTREEVKQASVRLRHALYKDISLALVFEDVRCFLAWASEGDPVVFWQCWNGVSGCDLCTTLPYEGRNVALETLSLEETAGRHVVLVDRFLNQNALWMAVDTARLCGAASVGVITPRRFFLDEELRKLGQQMSWMLIPDDISDQYHRFQQFCPDRIYSFPF